MNATSTHDTKRGEDVRARINVISEIAGEWREYLKMWSRETEPIKSSVQALPVPEPEMEALVYQTLVGAWPAFTDDAPKFRERLKAYVVKAAREAKKRTSWLSPDGEYEDALVAYIDTLFADSFKSLPGFTRLQEKIAFHGAVNSLSQVVLKAASPGVPDFYQGTELWDLSLVDPDNRRPVDFRKRTSFLDELAVREESCRLSLVRELIGSWPDGRVKLYATCRCLEIRRKHRDLFLLGRYLPLKATGRGEAHVFAFARRRRGYWAIAVTPRLTVGLGPSGLFPCGQKVWGDDILALPSELPPTWRNVFTGETIDSLEQPHGLKLSEVFSSFPVALLLNA